MRCERCANEQWTKAGRDRAGRQIFRCMYRGRRRTVRTGSTFSEYRFPDQVIALAVRWDLRYRRSYVEVAEWLAERGITVDSSTLFDWVQTFTPRFVEAAQQHRQRVGTRWRADETLLKIAAAGGICFGPSTSTAKSSTSTRATGVILQRPMLPSSERSAQPSDSPPVWPVIKPSVIRRPCASLFPQSSIGAPNTSIMVSSAINGF